MPAKYERLPTSPDSYSPDSYSPPSTRSPSPSEITFPPPRSASRMAREAERTRELQRQTERDPRFNVPPPSTWKRVALLLFVGLLFWLSFYVKLSKPEKPKVIHANRYVLFFLLVPYSIFYSSSFSSFGCATSFAFPLHLICMTRRRQIFSVLA